MDEPGNGSWLQMPGQTKASPAAGGFYLLVTTEKAIPGSTSFAPRGPRSGPCAHDPNGPSDGVSFRHLLDELRRELARQWPRDTGMSIVAIAETLGYADAAASTRAFWRWFGTTPTDWRAAQRQG